jgi:hypothetical protein
LEGWHTLVYLPEPELVEELKNNVDARATEVGIMKSSPQEDPGARQKVG